MKIPPIVYILLVLVLAGGGYYFFKQSQSTDPGPDIGRDGAPPLPAPESAPQEQSSSPERPASPGQSAAGNLRIDGSTSMVAINKALSIGYQQSFPEANVTYQANGTNQGIAALLSRRAEIAAASRPLKPEEAQEGLKAVVIAADEIAVVVGVKNPFKGGLTTGQLADIFSGRATNWSQVGGPNQPLKVVNRNPDSGTYEFFQKVVLDNQPFAAGKNVTTLLRDETTPLLRALGTDGIGYATSTQAVRQKTVRVVPINDLLPASNAEDYPLRRNLYYIYLDPPSPQVESFLKYAQSSEAKQAIRRYGF